MDDLVKRLRDYEERPFYLGDVDKRDLIAAADLLEAQAALIAEAREAIEDALEDLSNAHIMAAGYKLRGILAKLDNA